MPAEVAWELFAVRYVFTDAEELPVESTLIARDYPQGETLNLHRLTDPRPYAHLVYNAVIAEDDEAARDLMRDSDFDLRNTVVLAEEPDIALPDTPPEDAQAEVISLAPEALTISVTTPENAILTVAQVDYPGWTVQLDDETIEPIRAYGALTAIPLPAGTHTITYRYEPLSFRVGAAISVVTWVGLLVLAVFAAWRRMGQRSNG
jgi:hypothetical protein